MRLRVTASFLLLTLLVKSGYTAAETASATPEKAEPANVSDPEKTKNFNQWVFFVETNAPKSGQIHDYFLLRSDFVEMETTKRNEAEIYRVVGEVIKHSRLSSEITLKKVGKIKRSDDFMLASNQHSYTAEIAEETGTKVLPLTYRTHGNWLHEINIHVEKPSATPPQPPVRVDNPQQPAQQTVGATHLGSHRLNGVLVRGEGGGPFSEDKKPDQTHHTHPSAAATPGSSLSLTAAVKFLFPDAAKHKAAGEMLTQYLQDPENKAAEQSFLDEINHIHQVERDSAGMLEELRKKWVRQLAGFCSGGGGAAVSGDAQKVLDQLKHTATVSGAAIGASSGEEAQRLTELEQAHNATLAKAYEALTPQQKLCHDPGWVALKENYGAPKTAPAGSPVAPQTPPDLTVGGSGTHPESFLSKYKGPLLGAAGGLALGAAIGIFGGPAGIIIGAILGAALGGGLGYYFSNSTPTRPVPIERSSRPPSPEAP